MGRAYAKELQQGFILVKSPPLMLRGLRISGRRVAEGKTPSKYFLDPTTGAILDSQECRKQYPDLDQV